MFCPKCGIQNPETGKFCRSCGTDLGNVSEALSGKLQQRDQMCTFDSKGKPVTIEGSITKFFMGIAFVVVSIALVASGRATNWWFWMLIPAFMFIGGGIAQYVQIRNSERQKQRFSDESQSLFARTDGASLPPPKTTFNAPESRYKTGDLVPPSVTDSTTKHLEMNPEGETMTLPKR